ncbi:carboxypeptidase-like regulatory domain-containing protein [Sphingobacterium daejeonense]|uniref:carboxypeptidase-like regulatory domain-containing protein n=1 Tax=Sphingobacterium daejeonense TaxID=371142 RepID=UPI0010C343A7|nr:carboxypeptidase-like regulatory domain-containing protein [Sphingobacterium daejeonense]VTP99478.1 TonB-linked outer membrane protein, SusC/RagA family [Sphingobacterium daejeonense]
MLKYVWTALLFLSIGIVNAQTNNQYINGIVLDESAEPIVGASITVLEKDFNTTSDVHGNFKFKEGDGHQHLTLRVSAWVMKLLNSLFIRKLGIL